MQIVGRGALGLVMGAVIGFVLGGVGPSIVVGILGLVAGTILAVRHKRADNT